MFLCVNLSNLVPKGYQCELFGVGHRAFCGAMGTFVEGCQNRKKITIFQGKMKSKMFYYLKNHDGDGIALRYGSVITVQYLMPLNSGKPEPHSFLLSDLNTDFEVYIVGRILL